jgi:hypothetical protein
VIKAGAIENEPVALWRGLFVLEKFERKINREVIKIK